ncbi:MAG TPA: response regulator [Elusimicrobiales bacterium]|nr:response regulator [Elusimicrobiales bacterium]
MTDEPRVKITAIDDDESILEVYEAGLAAAGYDLVTFSDSRRAREFLDKCPAGDLPNVILLDIMMPGLDGITLMHHIRSKDSTAHIPIIAISGLNDAATLNDALLFGAMDYMVKPVDIAVLAEKIQKAAEVSKKRAPKP